MNLTKAIDEQIAKQQRQLAAAIAFRNAFAEGKRSVREKVGCGVKGCTNDARSLGYCATHYLKYRKLVQLKTAKELGWVKHPAPGSVVNEKGVTSLRSASPRR